MSASRLTRHLATLCCLSLLCLSLPARALLPIQSWQTASGARVLFVESHDLPMVDVTVQFPAGYARDTAATAGLANLTLQMARLAGGGLNEEEVSARLAETGAQLGTVFDADRAGLSLRSLSDRARLDPALEVLAGLLAQPAFPGPALQREVARAVTSLREADTRPETVAARAFARAVFGDHPYGLRGAGEPDTLPRLSVDDLRAFHRNHYGARGAVVALMGDLSADQARAIAEALTRALPDTPPPAAIGPVAALAAASTEHIAHPATQAHVFLGQPGMRRGDPDFFPLWVGNYVLGGGGFNSRLTEQVRERRGLSYSVYSYFSPYQQPGPLTIGLQTRRDQAEQALAVVRDTLATFVAEGPTDAELQGAKQNLVGGFPLRIDSSRKILDYLAVIAFYGLPLDYLERFPREVEQVTAEQVRDAFRRRVDPARMACVVVGGERPKP